eukprot:TRINITY_DN63212_c0_g1_i1.p1 TRINITY_DN63212_c0_g1~~TRINITY_DN63212_c0_g1_i1.p1  ORF type:complete len:690 (+),score=162.94 TRINITY_DN63212_c0_g1_i1:78-2147(+)
MALCSYSEYTKNPANLLFGLFVVGTVYRVVLFKDSMFSGREQQVIPSPEEIPLLEVDGSDSECIENSLFQMWHEEAEAEKNSLAKAEAQHMSGNSTSRHQSQERKSSEEPMSKTGSPSGSLRGGRQTDASKNAPSANLRGGRQDDGAEAKLAAEKEKLQQAEARRAEFDRLYEETKKAIHDRKSDAPRWAEIQAQLQSQYDNLPSRRQQLARERQKKFDKLFAEAEAALEKSANSVSPFAQHLIDTQARLQSQLDHLHDGHTKPSKLDKLFDEVETALAQHDTVSPWAKQLAESQAKMQEQLEHLHDGHKASSKLRGAPSTTKASEPPAKLRGAQRGGAQSLEWLPVKSWKERVPKLEDGDQNFPAVNALTLPRTKLRFVTEWKGAVPNVSCIMALPSTSQARYRFEYAVNNFKLQRYDGAAELVVVYHANDSVAARMVQNHSLGGRVRGVASRGSEFPSTMALRYGAWTSKADVIAQWDLEAWHHPERLSMQVRAMALSARPASLYVEKSAGSDESILAPPGLRKPRGHEGSLVGESAWMRQHWHPLLDEGDGSLELVQAHNLVLVDAPALAVDPHHSPLLPKDGASERHRDDALESRGTEVCRALVPESSTLNGVGPAGGDVSDDAFRSLLEKRKNVLDKLLQLCKEAENEIDIGKRAFMHHHAGRMDAVRAQMDAHLEAVGLLPVH